MLLTGVVRFLFAFRSFFSSSMEIFRALATASILAADDFRCSRSHFAFFLCAFSSALRFTSLCLCALLADFATETCRDLTLFSDNNSRLISSISRDDFVSVGLVGSSGGISELLLFRRDDRPRLFLPGERSFHFSWFDEPRDDRRNDFGSDLSDLTESRSGELELSRVSKSRPRRDDLSRIDFFT